MKISFSLSSKSVLEAKNKIKEYQKTYTKTLNDIIKQTADDSVKYAKKQLLKYNAYYSGRTYNSIYVLYTNKRKFRIHFGGASPYVEFGTGIIGQQHPQPEAEK